MDLHDAYEAVAREIEETAAKYAVGFRTWNKWCPANYADVRLAWHFEAQRAEIARAVEEASRS